MDDRACAAIHGYISDETDQSENEQAFRNVLETLKPIPTLIHSSTHTIVKVTEPDSEADYPTLNLDQKSFADAAKKNTAKNKKSRNKTRNKAEKTTLKPTSESNKGCDNASALESNQEAPKKKNKRTRRRKASTKKATEAALSKNNIKTDNKFAALSPKDDDTESEEEEKLEAPVQNAENTTGAIKKQIPRNSLQKKKSVETARDDDFAIIESFKQLDQQRWESLKLQQEFQYLHGELPIFNLRDRKSQHDLHDIFWQRIITRMQLKRMLELEKESGERSEPTILEPLEEEEFWRRAGEEIKEEMSQIEQQFPALVECKPRLQSRVDAILMKNPAIVSSNISAFDLEKGQTTRDVDMVECCGVHSGPVQQVGIVCESDIEKMEKRENTTQSNDIGQQVGIVCDSNIEKVEERENTPQCNVIVECFNIPIITQSDEIFATIAEEVDSCDDVSQDPRAHLVGEPVKNCDYYFWSLVDFLRNIFCTVFD